MKRRLLNVVAVLSLPLSLASAALLVRSYRVTDYLCHSRVTRPAPGASRARIWTCRTAPGVAGVSLERFLWHSAPHVDPKSPDGSYARWVCERHEPVGLLYRGGSFWNRCGFGVVWRDPFGEGRNSHFAAVYFPLWLPAAVFALPPSQWLRLQFKRRRRARAGLCPACGYDLRATPGRCPECGAAKVSGEMAAEPMGVSPGMIRLIRGQHL